MSLRNKINGLKEIWAFDNRFWLALTKIFFPGETVQIYRYRGLEILIDHAAGDANGARSVLATPMYSRFLPSMNLEKNLNILDFGANNGGFPLMLASNGLRLKKVVSVELNPRTHARLCFNLNRNLDCEVIALNSALCAENKTISVSLGVGSVSDNIYAHDQNLGTDICQIQGHTVDDYCEKYFSNNVIDICKIDVEGAEFEVFLTSSHKGLARCRYLIMEIHETPDRRAEDILPAIKQLGFVRKEPGVGQEHSVHFFVNANFEQI